MAHCITGRARSAVITTDLPRPSDEMHVTDNGEISFHRLACGAVADLLDAAADIVARDRDRAARVDDDKMERPFEAAALDKVGDEFGEALLIVRRHAGERKAEAARY